MYVGIGIIGSALSTESYCPNESWIYRATYVQPEPSDCYIVFRVHKST